jgi:hypothetical protein
MALITRASTASPDAISAQYAPQISDLICGEAIDPAAPCYIKASDGKVYMSNGTSANEAAKVDGFSPGSRSAGEPITLLGHGPKFKYGSGLTPGARYYVGATAGRLDGAATTGDAVGVARAISATVIQVIRDH